MRMSFLKSTLWQILLLVCVIVAEMILLNIVNRSFCDFIFIKRLLCLIFLGLTLSIITVSIVLGFISKQFRLPSTRIIHRFVDNSLDGDKIVLINLLFFLVHFTWFVDLAFEVVLRHNADDISTLFVVGSAWLCTLLFFPYTDAIEAGDENRKMIFTAISGTDVITWPNLDLMLKPLLVGARSTNRKHPRQTVQYTLESIETVVVIPSNKRQHDITVETLDTKNLNGKCCELICKCNQGVVNEINSKINEFNNKVSSFGNVKQWDAAFCNLLQGIMKLLKDGRDIKFIVGERANFNDFDDFKVSVVKALKDYEVTPNEVYLYVSPGTSIPTAVLSILSVVGGRKILYADQSEPNHVESVFIDKNTIDGWFESIQNENS